MNDAEKALIEKLDKQLAEMEQAVKLNDAARERYLAKLRSGVEPLPQIQIVCDPTVEREYVELEGALDLNVETLADMPGWKDINPLDLLAEITDGDLVELLLSGDTLSDDPFLAQIDGVMKRLRTSSHPKVINPSDPVPMQTDVLRALVKETPTQLGQPARVFLTSLDVRDAYLEWVAGRVTTGDCGMAENVQAKFAEIPIVGCPHFPSDTEEMSGSILADVLLLDPKGVTVYVAPDMYLSVDRVETLVQIKLKFKVALDVDGFPYVGIHRKVLAPDFDGDIWENEDEEVGG